MWNKFPDKVPEVGKHVLVRNRGGTMAVASLEKFGEWLPQGVYGSYGYEVLLMDWSSNVLGGEEVSHWRELPEQP